MITMITSTVRAPDAMWSILRCVKFYRPDFSGVVILELHRLMKLHAARGSGPGSVSFVVSVRVPEFNDCRRTPFGTIREAEIDWDQRARKLEDTGLRRQDRTEGIAGFHEEG